MTLTHLHLHVRDRSRSEQFYATWFGMIVASRDEDLSFLTDEAGFDLALMGDEQPAAFPAWFHFGYRLDSGQAVAALHGRMAGAAVPIVRPLCDDETMVSFRCADPDGYAVEVYWEAPVAPKPTA